MGESLTSLLAQFVAKFSFNDIPHEVIAQAKRLILDSIGCGLGGCKTIIANIVTKFIESIGGVPESTVIGVKHKTNCINAAFANAAIANALDADDTYLNTSHPAVPILSAALALGEKVEASGKELLSAFVTGYEVFTRIKLATIPTFKTYRRLHGLATWQVFGAVVAASKILGLNLDQTVNALGIAGANAPVQSFWKFIESSKGLPMVKYGSPWSAELGVSSALLAKMGFTGMQNILDGDRGFWVMAGSDCCNFEKMTSELGMRYEILKTSFKPYPACRWIHPSIDALLILLHKTNIALKDIEEIIVKTFTVICTAPYNNPRPITLIDAQFSIPYTLAVAATGIKPGPKWFDPEIMNNPNILNLSQKIKLVGDPQVDREFPRKMMSKIELTLRDGEKVKQVVEVPKGEPENPLTYKDLLEKFREFASIFLKYDQIKEVINHVNRLEKLSNIADLTKLLTGRDK